ncbi:superoxide dismutase family protein [Flavobacteriaceae bacterium AH-315-B10]|nr:superoxide dismutase family protein [Flavobacteriaceae bacterium AH-315-B10]
MKKAFFFILIFTLVFTVACKGEKKETETNIETTYVVSSVKYTESKIAISLESKSNSNVTGNVVFTQDGDLVTMVATMSSLSEGTHAIHLHEKADCSSDDGKSSGGHWNPTAQPHGKWGADEGFHQGDIGNFEADADGNGSITFTSNTWCIGCGDDTKDILGKAVIVHEGTDDFTSQPSGAAGTRVSCGGVIE